MKNTRGKKYFIQEHLFRDKIYHGGIGNKDIEKILLQNGFQAIAFPYHFDFSLKAKLFRFFYLIKTLLVLPKESIVIFQSPLYAKIHKLLIRVLRSARTSIKIICFITDINGLKDGNQQSLKKEVAFYKSLKSFIVHNQAMQTWLLEEYPQANIVLIEFFDFLADVPHSARVKNYSVAFAGLLDKSRFITQLSEVEQLDFYLYGPIKDFLIENNSHIHYRGVFDPQELPKIIEGSFGLIWDGNSAFNLDGVFGEYNKIISPHKLSFYVLSGLPVIAHSKSGSAQLIGKYKIGFTVNSLREIPKAIESLSEGDYVAMRKNCLQLAKDISEGKFLIAALEKLGFG